MLAITKTAALSGINGIDVTVEINTSNGLPGFYVIGLGDMAVKESADRVHGGIVNSGFDYPQGKIIANLSPAWVRKKGSHYDLAIAVGVLVSSGVIDQKSVEGKAFIGEISLAGEITPVKGILPMMSGLAGKVKEVYLAPGNLKEGYLASKGMGIKIVPAYDLRSVVSTLNSDEKPEYYQFDNQEIIKNGIKYDFADVKGNWEAKEAITVAIAGGHGLLMVGSPGTGKTMLAKRIPSILPEMRDSEILETSMIYSLVGELDDARPVITERPFVQISSRDTEVSILGGGHEPLPGAVSKAHNGVLFLDEMLEFSRQQIELLRKPIEEKSIAIVRHGQVYRFPAGFTLVAATNPCRCGYYGDRTKACTCSLNDVERYQNKLSGPLSERIDMCVEMNRVDYDSLTSKESLSSNEMRKRVEKARAIQTARFNNFPITLNSEMEEAQINEFCKLDEKEQEFMSMVYNHFTISPRRYHKILKLARTIADVNEREKISSSDLSAALAYTKFFNRRGDENEGIRRNQDE